jgi:hypothetical protein
MVMSGVLADVMLRTALRCSGLVAPGLPPRVRVGTRYRLAGSIFKAKDDPSD